MVYVTMMRLSDNLLYSGRTIWQSKSNQYCTKPLNSSPHFELLYTNAPGEFRSPGSTLIYASPDTLPQIHRGSALGQKATARAAKKPPYREKKGAKRNSRQATFLGYGVQVHVVCLRSHRHGVVMLKHLPHLWDKTRCLVLGIIGRGTGLRRRSPSTSRVVARQLLGPVRQAIFHYVRQRVIASSLIT